MKKIAALASALMLLICAASCGSKAGNDDEISAANETALLSFRSADIDMADDFSEILCTDKIASNYLIFGKLQSGEYCGYLTDTGFAEKRAFTFTPENGETVRTAALMRFGGAAVLTTLGDSTFIYTFSTDGDPQKVLEPGDILSSDDHYTELLCTENGFYININRYGLAYVDNAGNYRGNVNVAGRTVCGLVSDSSGVPCVLMSRNSEMTLAALDEADITEETGCGELADYTNSICTGIGDHRAAVMVTGGLYTLNGGKWLHITDFVDNDFGTNDILDIEMISGEEFTVLLRNTDGSYSVRLLSQRDISEIKQKRVIRMAYMYGGNSDPYSNVIKRYNADNEEYRIEMVCYKGEHPEPYRQLQLDIISGKCPDIIHFSTYLPPESFGGRESMFVDLYDYIDKDADIHREDFLEGFLEGMETNGRLLRLAPSFSIFTNVIKEKYAKGLTSWDYDDFEMMCRSMPDNMRFSGAAAHSAKKMLFVDLMDYSSFVDKDNGKCSFDSPEFIRAMKLIRDNGIGLSIGEISPGYNEGSVDGFRNNENLTEDWMITSISEIRWIKYVYAAEDFTFIGYPGNERITAYSRPTATYGIMASSPYRDEAWEFLKYYMFSEDSIRQDGFGSIPALERLYTEELKYECETHPYIDPDTGEETDKEYYYYYPAGVHTPTIIEMFPFDEDEAKKYDEFIRTAVKHQRYPDNNVRTILMDELDSYFEGEKSAEQVAEIIQNRVSIYLSEQY